MKEQLAILALWLGLAMTMVTQTDTKNNGNNNNYPKPVDMKEVLPTSVYLAMKDPDIQASMAELDMLEVPKFNYHLPSPAHPMQAQMYPNEKRLMAEMERDMRLRKLYMAAMRGANLNVQRRAHSNVYRNALAKSMHETDMDTPVNTKVEENIHNENNSIPDIQDSGDVAQQGIVPESEDSLPTVIHHPYLQNFAPMSDQMSGKETTEHPEDILAVQSSGPYGDTERDETDESLNELFHDAPDREDYEHAERNMEGISDQEYTEEGHQGFAGPQIIPTRPYPTDYPASTQTVYRHAMPDQQRRVRYPFNLQEGFDRVANPGIYHSEAPSRSHFIDAFQRRMMKETVYHQPESRTYPRSERGVRHERYDADEESRENDMFDSDSRENGDPSTDDDVKDDRSYVTPVIVIRDVKYLPVPTSRPYLPRFISKRNRYNDHDVLPDRSEERYHSEEGYHDNEDRSEETYHSEEGYDDKEDPEDYHGVYSRRDARRRQSLENENFPYHVLEIDDSSSEESQREDRRENLIYPTPSHSIYPTRRPQPYYTTDSSESQDKATSSGSSEFYEDIEENPTVAPTMSSYEAQLRESFSDFHQSSSEESQEKSRQRRHQYQETGDVSSKRQLPSPGPTQVSYVPLRIAGYYGNHPYSRPNGYIHFPNPYLAFSPYRQYRNHPYYSSKEYHTLVHGPSHRNVTSKVQTTVHGNPTIAKYDNQAAPKANVVYRPHPYGINYGAQIEQRSTETATKDNPFRAVYYQYRNHPFYRLKNRRNQETNHRNIINVKPTVIQQIIKRPVQGKEGIKQTINQGIKPKPENIYTPPPAHQSTFRVVPYVMYNKIPDYDPSIHRLPTSPPNYTPVNGSQRYCYNCGTLDQPATHPHLGWKRCLYAFHHDEAAPFGVEEELCHDNCYIKVGKNNSVFRGCYRGEVGVDPSKTGCHKQGESGTVYCFCDGSRCNNYNAPEYF